jgi:hypothetical protein
LARGRDASLELAYAASRAYAAEAANLAVIDGVLDELFERAGVGDGDGGTLRGELRAVLVTNRTAPACMRMMALADEARAAIDEARAAAGRRDRRAFRKHADKTRAQLVKQVAATLDALLAESS